MESDEVREWAEDFAAFHARFASLFGRSEPRAQAVKYLRGLMGQMERKNGWQMAEAVGDALPDRMQRLLYRAEWDAEAARDILQQFVVEVFGDEEAIGVVDETGFIKQGDRSVGVKRQYSGTAGKVENSQVATFLSYATCKGHAFLDRRLYLPEEWCDDAPRRGRAKVPEKIRFQTKPEQAMAMLEHAWEKGGQLPQDGIVRLCRVRICRKRRCKHVGEEAYQKGRAPGGGDCRSGCRRGCVSARGRQGDGRRREGGGCREGSGYLPGRPVPLASLGYRV